MRQISFVSVLQIKKGNGRRTFFSNYSTKIWEEDLWRQSGAGSSSFLEKEQDIIAENKKSFLENSCENVLKNKIMKIILHHRAFIL